MPVFPYRKRPVPPSMALLCEDGLTALTEDAGVVALTELPEGYRVWGSWDRVTELWGDGLGEALCWQARPVRWRPWQSEGPVWRDQPNDVRVLRVQFPEEDDRALEGLVRWRDWLGQKGAAPAGSLGSSAFSLLRATLRKPLWTSVGNVPPIPYIMGGRQELVSAMGRYEPARHYDLPAAYAQALGQLRYGGAWATVGGSYPYAMVARRGVLCFVRARVRVPKGLPLGPLCTRPKRPPKGTDALLSFSMGRYPTGKVVQGIWTWEEVEVASEAGCKVKVLDVWVLSSGTGVYPFKPWWEEIQEGRGLPGFAGLLGKATGNALWGQFCITPTGAERTVQHWTGTRHQPKRWKRTVPLSGSSPHYAPDLAETLTGRVRADLYRCMMAAGDPLLCAHTDGIWTQGEVDTVPEEWRAKEKVARLDLITPQFMRYYRHPGGHPEYVVAGAPDTLAPALFERVWGSLARDGRVPL